MLNRLYTVFFLSLFICSVLACKNQSESQGNCKSCASGTQTLVQGYCYTRITGCMRYQIGPICIQCQFGYVLIGNDCIRSAIANGNTDLSPAPIVPDNATKLALPQIRNQLSQTYGPYFNIVNDKLLTQNPFLSLIHVKQVKNIKTIKGRYISIRYQVNQKQYEGSAFVNRLNQVQQIKFNQFNGRPTDPISAVNLIIANKQLTGFTVYQILGSYVIDFLNDDNSTVMRFKISQTDMGSLSQISIIQNIVSQKLTIADLALEEVLKNFTFFKGSTIITEVKENGFYVFYIGLQNSVSVQYKGGYFIINRPLTTPLKQPIANTGNVTLVGNFRQLTNLQDKNFLESLEFVRTSFPQLKNYQVSKVQQQVVAGVNYLITFSSKNESFQYQIKVYRALTGSLRILQGERRDLAIVNAQPVVVYSEDYNYNDHERFFFIYSKMLERSRIANELPIQSVTKKQSKQQIFFRVSYSAQQYMEFNINNGQAMLLGYYVKGQNIIDLLSDLTVVIDFQEKNFNVTEQTVATEIIQNKTTTLKNTTQKIGNQTQQVCIPPPKQLFFTLIKGDISYEAIVLRNKINRIIRSANPNWILFTPVLILYSNNTARAYIDVEDKIIQIQINLVKGQITKTVGLVGSTNLYMNSQLQSSFQAYKLIIPQGPQSTQPSRNLVKSIAKASQEALKKQILAPKILLAVRISLNAYRLLVTTDLSPVQEQAKYYVQFDTYVQLSGFAQFYNVKRIQANTVSLTQCSKFSAEAQCLSCTQQQLSFYGACYKKIVNCLVQNRDYCFDCNPGYQVQNYRCTKICKN